MAIAAAESHIERMTSYDDENGNDDRINEDSKSATCRRTTLRTQSELDTNRSLSQLLYRLPFYATGMFATVLEDVLVSMKILKQCNNSLRIQKTLADWERLREVKFDIRMPPRTEDDELAGVTLENINCDEFKLNKLDADRNFVIMVLQRTYEELSLRCSYEPLVAEVEKLYEKERRLKWLIEEEIKNRALCKQFHRQLRQQRNYQKTEEYDCDVIKDTLEKQCEDAALCAETESRYVGAWQNARTEQHDLTINGKEAVFRDSIEQFKLMMDYEQRVHSEISLLTAIIIDERLKEVEEWMAKYDVDMEKIDLDIFKARNQYNETYDERVYLQEKYVSHERAIREWQAFTKERDRKRKYEADMTRSAICVQAWWRGLLVRKELGPYKPKKKPKEKPKPKW